MPPRICAANGEWDRREESRDLAPPRLSCTPHRESSMLDSWANTLDCCDVWNLLSMQSSRYEAAP